MWAELHEKNEETNYVMKDRCINNVETTYSSQSLEMPLVLIGTLNYIAI